MSVGGPGPLETWRIPILYALAVGITSTTARDVIPMEGATVTSSVMSVGSQTSGSANAQFQTVIFVVRVRVIVQKTDF